MPRSPRKLYEDILQAISELEAFCKNKDIDDFLEDRQLQLTAERELEIIGEALSRCPSCSPDRAAAKQRHGRRSRSRGIG